MAAKINWDAARRAGFRLLRVLSKTHGLEAAREVARERYRRHGKHTTRGIAWWYALSLSKHATAVL